ncbi:MAG: Na+/H+ antiporter subunit E [Alphaproteobacteria bacterium]|nr:Na+/H+ antiporter subunit E [Alphaproteobacteria bacterium]
MVRFLLLALILMGLWLLMSGHYTVLVTSLGVVSVLFTAAMSARMGGTDDEGLPLHMVPRLPRYVLWLIKEIITANIATAKVILTNSHQGELFRVAVSQSTEAGIATYANSITLTPGTVTVDIDDDGFLVHALTSEFGDDVRSGVMDAKVTAVEGKGSAS